MRKQFGTILLVGGLALTTARSGAAVANSAPTAGVATPATTPVAGAQQMTIEVGNAMTFAPSAITARAGQPVELTLRNEGFIPHDFTLPEDVPQPVKIEAPGRPPAARSRSTGPAPTPSSARCRDTPPPACRAPSRRDSATRKRRD